MGVRIWVFVGIFLLAVSGVLTMSLTATQIEITRQSTVNVTPDTTSIVQLTPNSQYEIVKLSPQGNLTISPSNLNAYTGKNIDSLNANMYLSIGDETAPNQNYAFKIDSLTNTTTAYDISLIQQSGYTSTADSVEYIIQKDTGTPQTIIADGSKTSFVLNSTETLYVSVVFDTRGEQTGNLDTTLLIGSQTNL